jgi:DNA-directed RNA polymerase specialized sigma subunit
MADLAREKAFYDLRNEGKTYAQVGEAFGVTGSRAIQLVHKYRHRLRREQNT